METKEELGDADGITRPAPAMQSDELADELSLCDGPELAVAEVREAVGIGVEAASVDEHALEDGQPNARAASSETALAPSPAPLSAENFLLVSQLALSAPDSGNADIQQRLGNDAVDLYRSLRPQDAIESLLGRIMVGVTNVSMDCLVRAAQCKESMGARDLNLRHGMKGAAIASDLAKQWDRHRGQGRQNVTVGTVSVEAGGQAVVGNVEIGGQRKQTASPAPRASTTESDE